MYSELHCKTNFSFLTGASHADELVDRAVELGYHALAITDENTLAGVVRAHSAARAANEAAAEADAANQNFKLIIGAEIILNDALPALLWATDRASYAKLSKLITIGRRRAPKAECWLSFDDLANHHEGLLVGVLPHLAGQPSRIAHIDADHPSFEWYRGRSADETVWQNNEQSNGRNSCHPTLQKYRELFGDRAYLMATLYHGVDDAWRLGQLQQLSQQTQLPLVASGDVLYHRPARLPLHDVLTATKHHTNVATAGDLLLPNAQRHLKTIAEHQSAFASNPAAIARTQEITDRCNFSLSDLRYEYPEELAPEGKTPVEHLSELTDKGAAKRYPEGVPDKVTQLLQHELQLIEDLRYEAYFLTVWDLVRFARKQGILCQGRGSAANSAVCYCLGVTSVDPASTDLLFERFISKERNEAPDIDVDFEHERREEVLQYLYQKYGRDRAGLAATVVTYRIRSAVRDVGKALGLSLDRIDALAKLVEGYSTEPDLAGKMRDAGIDPDSDIGQQLIYLVNDLLGFPRHLSQHVGGMVITQGALDELVPIENASMDNRTVIQWDKDDLEELGLLKVDCLCLGMLSAIQALLCDGAAALGAELHVGKFAARGSVGIRHDLRRGYGGRVSNRKPRANEHVAAFTAALLLRFSDRSLNRATGPHSRQYGASIFATSKWRRGSGLSQRGDQTGFASDTGRANLSGTSHEAGGGGGWFYTGRSGSVATSDGEVANVGRD